MRMRTFLTSGLAVLTLSATAQAGVLFDVAFDAETAGNPPSIAAATPGGITTQLSFVNSAAGIGNVVKTSTATFGSGSNYLEMADSTAAAKGIIKLELAGSDAVSSASANPLVTISWDMMISSGVTGQTGKYFVDLRDTSGQDLARLRIDVGAGPGAGGMGFRGDGIFQNGTDVLTLDESHSLKIELNYTTSQVTYSRVTGPSVVQTFDNTRDFARVDFTSLNGTISVVSLDNLKIETIPEPASSVLLGLSGLAILASRKR